MPNRDGTGPTGQGPRTGRGMGNCPPSKKSKASANASLKKCTGNKDQAAAIHAQMDKEKKKRS